jgi:hypothetical protein
LKSAEHAATFKARMRADHEAARAEALLFSVLRSLDLNPAPAEDPSTGGADFLCGGKKLPRGAVVEVSVMRADAVSERSGLPKKIDANGQGRWFSMITDALRSKASRKAGQLKDQTGARILAITLEHAFADMLMGSLAARWLMSGETKISVPIEPAPGDVTEVTHLEESAFVRFTAGGIESCRRSISAILLVSIDASDSRAIGLLHPDPAVPLDYTAFFPIPFLAITNWPLHRGDAIQTEWRMPVTDPDPHPFVHQPPWLADKELKG